MAVGQAVIDGEDEKPLAFMREAHVRRAEEAKRTLVTKASQVSSYLIGAEREVAADVFEEDGPRSGLDNAAADDGPEVARIGDAPTLAGETERLARVARNDEIHSATPVSAAEGSGICEDRRVSQGARLHLRHQCSAGEGFDLHHADRASIWNCQLDGAVKSASSRGDGHHIGGR